MKLLDPLLLGEARTIFEELLEQSAKPAFRAALLCLKTSSHHRESSGETFLQQSHFASLLSEEDGLCKEHIWRNLEI